VSRSDPKYAEYYELLDRRNAAIGDGLCTPHMARGHQSERVPAAYRWDHGTGHVDFLCESCCCWWRQFAAEDPAMLPARIDLLR
jgi:hypothetical protein